ncbi:MAG: CmcI family methyltransferase [Ilumatobacteraceae bacterium]
MARGIPIDLHAVARAEQARRLALEAEFRSTVESRAFAAVRWIRRITRRGPDLASIDRLLAESLEPVPLRFDGNQWLIDRFHKLYYDYGAQTWRDTWWLGIRTLKCPLDLWLYQELLQQVRPDVVIECGTKYGGSAFYLASILDLIGHGSVVTIDITEQPGRPEHPRIEYITSSSVDASLVEQLAARCSGLTTLVILDSDHSRDHVLAELQAYAPLVSVGSYLIVEDTNIHGHPVLPDHPPGPAEAVEAFLPGRDDYVVAPIGEKFFLTFNPGGVLQRVR